jgi:hypothetical protein
MWPASTLDSGHLSSGKSRPGSLGVRGERKWRGGGQGGGGGGGSETHQLR